MCRIEEARRDCSFLLLLAGIVSAARMLEASRRALKTRYFYETHTRRGAAPNQTESIQGTRRHPRLAPEKFRNVRLWVVAAPPEDRLIRV